MLQLELSHIYKDIYSVFKTYKFKTQEELHIDNFKDTIEKFISHIKKETENKGMKYYSFEDIKEQDNEESVHQTEKKNNSNKL